MPVSVSSTASIRPIANEIPGGIEAVMLTSEIRYGDCFSRSDVLVISWSAVDLMMRSASTPGSIRSTTVDTPRRAAPRADRVCWPSFSWVAGSAAVRWAMPAAC